MKGNSFQPLLISFSASLSDQMKGLCSRRYLSWSDKKCNLSVQILLLGISQIFLSITGDLNWP